MVKNPLKFKEVVDAHLELIEALRVGPYAPPWPGCADPGRSASGEDFAVVALKVSEDFYAAEDDGESLDAAYEEMETERWAVVLALDTRWGPHRTESLQISAEREAAGLAVPPPLCALCELGYFDDLQVWESGARAVAVGVGQMDKEEPIVLFAVVAGSAGAFDPTD
ncbi:hypothetical protein ACFVW8_17665 [Streptomyces sp. NPDC058221]|uniref:hypothetical protein n=1 Tax=Streptomyces sp. NPDC058221 TaxID=3346388 RepID=UPI0036EB29B6